MIRMYDSITAADIPADAPAVAGYVDGPYRWSAADWDRFTTRRRVRIATRATTLDADAADVERGDLTPEQAPSWVRNARPAPGRLPMLYVNRSNRAAVEAACRGLRYWLWVATLDALAVMQPGAIATQWAGQTSGSGGHFDLSLVDEVYFGAALASATGGGGMLVSESSDREPLWEVRIRIGDRHLMLAWWSGGMGQRDSYTGPLTDLGRPAAAALPVEASVTTSTHVAGHLRANVAATLDDGSEWGLVYGDEPGNVNGIVQPWAPAGVPSNCPAVYVPGGQPGPAGPDVRPAVAAALQTAADQLRKAS